MTKVFRPLFRAFCGLAGPCLPAALIVAAPALQPAQKSADPDAGQPPATMTKMIVRLTGPRIRPGSFAALPKTLYRAGEHYARIEDPPDARQKIQKLTVILGRDAYSANLIGKTGTHALDQGDAGALQLPIVAPFDPQHRLGKLDGLEFGREVEFFQAAGAQKQSGPVINAKPTDEYQLKLPSGPATLVLKQEGETPVWLSWETADGKYRYEYIVYDDVPFEPGLFTKPGGIKFKEIPPDPSAGRE